MFIERHSFTIMLWTHDFEQSTWNFFYYITTVLIDEAVCLLGGILFTHKIKKAVIILHLSTLQCSTIIIHMEQYFLIGWLKHFKT